MRRLTARRRDEQGATMIIVAFLLVALMMMAALVVDVGALLQERRELQNGADAAALSVAHSCALDEAACRSPAPGAQALADGNATDSAAAVDGVAVDRPNRRVTAITSTRTSSGGTILPFRFAQVSGDRGQAVRARAAATWGPPATGISVRLTLSRCEFDAAGLGKPTVVFFHSTSGKGTQPGRPTDCPAGPAGKDIPGGFGWLDPTPDEGCSAAVDAGGWVSVDPGASAPKACDVDELVGTTVLVPIFDDVTGSGTGATYHIAGFGAFELTGYRFPSGGSGGSPRPCSSPHTCVGGTFTKFVTSPGPIGGSDFGVSVVKLVS